LVSAIFMSSRELPFRKMVATLTLSPSMKGEDMFFALCPTSWVA
jgi:hypothetical protein